MTLAKDLIWAAFSSVMCALQKAAAAEAEVSRKGRKGTNRQHNQVAPHFTSQNIHNIHIRDYVHTHHVHDCMPPPPHTHPHTHKHAHN